MGPHGPEGWGWACWNCEGCCARAAASNPLLFLLLVLLPKGESHAGRGSASGEPGLGLIPPWGQAQTTPPPTELTGAPQPSCQGSGSLCKGWRKLARPIPGAGLHRGMPSCHGSRTAWRRKLPKQEGKRQLASLTWSWVAPWQTWAGDCQGQDRTGQDGTGNEPPSAQGQLLHCTTAAPSSPTALSQELLLPGLQQAFSGGSQVNFTNNRITESHRITNIRIGRDLRR